MADIRFILFILIIEKTLLPVLFIRQTDEINGWSVLRLTDSSFVGLTHGRHTIYSVNSYF